MEGKPPSQCMRGKGDFNTSEQHSLPLNPKDKHWLWLHFLTALHDTSISYFLFAFRMAMFVSSNKLSFLRSLLIDFGKIVTWELRSYATLVGEAATFSTNDGVIPEVRLQEQSKAAEERGPAEEKKKAFWMRDPATGAWFPEDHFGEIHVVDLRAKLLPSRKYKMT